MSRVWRRLFITHAAVVVLLTTVFLVATFAAAPEDGVDIGAAVLALPLLPLGLPWSWPALSDPYQFDGLSTLPWIVVTFGPAMLNVLLHGVALMVVSRIRRRRPGDRLVSPSR
ncbi:hypothetical protein SAMN04488085_104387 [Geodermatophilus ruber]|uniref:Uncharacterized protein n=1 Tax=Geodermatophilus ruber TaxID=504800 RepID=A0A1I4DKU3_9ACTN|nr:hypothetical protein SAMN04488085_104387 [Geodermatophilus ruber]